MSGAGKSQSGRDKTCRYRLLLTKDKPLHFTLCFGRDSSSRVQPSWFLIPRYAELNQSHTREVKNWQRPFQTAAVTSKQSTINLNSASLTWSKSKQNLVRFICTQNLQLKEKQNIVKDSRFEAMYFQYKKGRATYKRLHQMLPGLLRQLPTLQLLKQGQGHTACLHGAKKIMQQAKLD